jgi:hypothetical protein
MSQKRQSLTWRSATLALLALHVRLHPPQPVHLAGGDAAFGSVTHTPPRKQRQAQQQRQSNQRMRTQMR